MEANGPTSTIEPEAIAAAGRPALLGRADGDAATRVRARAATEPHAARVAPDRLGSGAPGSS